MTLGSIRNLQQHPLIYLATPYSTYKVGHDKAFQHACLAAATLIRQGVHCYCPIAHTHPIADYGMIDKLDHSIWLALDSKLLVLCNALVISDMPGWQESRGVRFEWQHFKDRSKPIYIGCNLHSNLSPHIAPLTEEPQWQNLTGPLAN